MPNTKIANLRGPGGAQGAQGNPGASGPTGSPGAAATIAVGTTTTGASGTAANVVNTGTSNAAVFNFTIPQGIAGAAGSTGPQGATGPQGPTGATGPAGPSTPSSNTGNLLAIGSDSLLYLPPSALDQEIWSVRLRSFNAIGNPTFEIDQRNVGNVVTNPGSGTFIQDRWFKGGGGTYAVNGQQVSSTSGLVVPGTNFRISCKQLNVTLTTQETTLAAGDLLAIRQTPEGTQFRELNNDVHSISVLVYSTVAPLSFSVFLRDIPGLSRSLVKLCTIPTANTWSLITLPNLPVWAAGGTWNNLPGTQGYDFGICLACGSTLMAPAADTWQNGNFVGAPGMSNWCASPVNSVFYLGFVQHEPGAICTTLIDKPFNQNYDECLRYFQKSCNYGTQPFTASGATGVITMTVPASSAPMGPVPFKRPMAKTPPTVTGWSHATGAVNNVRDNNAGVDRAISSVAYVGDSGFSGFNIATTNAAATVYSFHYIADIGW